MGKNKANKPRKTYTLTGWSDKIIQPVIDSFKFEFPVQASETGLTFKQIPLIDIGGQYYSLAYFTYEPA